MVRVSSIPIYIPGGRTPLHFAADRGQLDIARELLARGAQVASDFDGNLPIDLALLRKDAPLVQLFDVERQLLTSAEVAAKLRSDHLHRQHRIEQKQKEKRRAKMMATFTTSAEASSS
jgi:ankyrin repeat protein